MFYVVCIVVAVLLADAFKKYLNVKQKQQENDPELEESLKKIDSLEERIQVLERIVTESKRDLGEEIDHL
jgi:hypothetical protein